jgi:hypothetical protein
MMINDEVDEAVAIDPHSTASTRSSQGQDSVFSGRGPRTSDHPTTMTSVSMLAFILILPTFERDVVIWT